MLPHPHPVHPLEGEGDWWEDGVWVFDLPPDTLRVTTQQVQQLLEESA
jgi:hypothetical protein